MALRIVVVDELPLICDGIAAAFNGDPTCRIVDRGANAADAVRLVDENRTDLLIFGVSNIDDTLATIGKVVAKANAVGIICLTPSGTESAMQRFLQAGARGCISKRADGAELVRCVEMVRNGGRYVSPSLAIYLLNMSVPRVPAAKPVHNADTGILTAREIEILQLVSTGQSNKVIAQKLALSEKSVKRYMTCIMQKIHVRNRLQAALYLKEHAVESRMDLANA